MTLIRGRDGGRDGGGEYQHGLKLHLPKTQSRKRKGDFLTFSRFRLFSLLFLHNVKSFAKSWPPAHSRGSVINIYNGGSPGSHGSCGKRCEKMKGTTE